MEEKDLETAVQGREREMAAAAQEREAAAAEQGRVYGEAAVQSVRAKSGFKLTGSTAAKVAAALLMFVSAVMCVAGVLCCLLARETEMYSGTYKSVLREALSGQTSEIAYTVYDYFNSGHAETMWAYLEETNAEVAILRAKDVLSLDGSVFLWKSYEDSAALEENGFYSSLYGDVQMEFPLYAPQAWGFAPEEPFIVRVFYDPAFPKDDQTRMIAMMASTVYRIRYAAIPGCVGSILLFIICGIFLLCGAGHKNGREGIVPGLLTGIPFDIMTFGLGLAAFLPLCWGLGGWSSVWEALAVAAGGVLLLMLCALYLCDLAIRIKLGSVWRNTLIFRLFQMLLRALSLLWRGVKAVLRLLSGVALVPGVVAIYWGICFLEFLIVCIVLRSREPSLWVVGKLILFPAVLYITLTMRKLLVASRKLAEGQEGYRVDTARMFGAFKEQGENLNSLGQGISRAVAERMKSERLKTELITNVSHDLKTPLTSIINYAELIGREAAAESVDAQKVREYSEVLFRQSGRLKRLLESLVEASKAATGSLEVSLEPCEAGVMLSQAAGEYQKRLGEKGLELRVSQPEEPVRILADGRHLWRVFDNLLNNICKYAQEGSRVYLTLEKQEDKALIVFRNMSKYALDVPAAELEDRFVRGDKSRHLEGNGLGLSIARSLTELLGGRMNIVIDGDLFKVVLTFALME